MLRFHLRCFPLPIDTKRRIGNDEVKGHILKLIITESITKLHIVGITATDEHVGFGNTKGERIDFLPVTDKISSLIQSRKAFLHAGQHLAGAHRHIVDGVNASFLCHAHSVGEQVTHQIDDVTAGEVSARFLIVGLRKTLDKVFKDIAHVHSRDLLWTHVCFFSAEITDDLIEQASVGHALQLGKEIHASEDIHHII